MDAKTLRASILQMAIEGKLVPQRDEEPVVEQIGEAPEDVPFEIPEKWKWVRLSATGKITGGGTPKTSCPEYWEGDIPWITPADLGKQKTQKISRGAKSITQLGLNNSSAKLMPAGSVIYSSRAPIGYAAIAINPLCTNQGCKSLVPNHAVISSDWGYWCLIARTADIISRASGTTFKEISGKGVGETWIPLPPLAEQQRIVDRLNKLLPFVDEFGKAQEALAVAQKEFPEKLKASLLQEAIQGKLVPQLDEEPAVEQIGEAPEDVPFAIPEKWTWANFNTVITTITTKKYQIPTKEIKSSGKFPVISQSKQAIDGFSDDIDRVVPTSNLPCVLFGDHTRVVKKITAPCIIGADGTKLITSTFLDNDFLFYLISSISPQLREAGYSRHFKFLKAHPLPIPPIAEQRRIVARLNKLLPLVDRMAAQATANK